MIRIGIARERKWPPDNRVALTPEQCQAIQAANPDIHITVEPSPDRCFSDAEYEAMGVAISEDLNDCDIILAIKEVPPERLLPYKTYLFFSHTKKKQPHNKKLMRALIEKHIRMIDYECMTYEDNQRVLGFGLYAGIVGAHNGLLTYGKKFGLYSLPPAHTERSYQDLIKHYAGIKLPPMKIAITGSGKVAAGVLEVMAHLDIENIEPQDFINKEYTYPVYTYLKGDALYRRIDDGTFGRDDFHKYPEAYQCLFDKYVQHTDILMNGIYWHDKIPRLFSKADMQQDGFRIDVIADVTCDVGGSVPVNTHTSTIADPVYGIYKKTLLPAPPFQPTHEITDIMAVDNLPNELPRDASHYFGLHLEKYVLQPLLQGESDMIQRATLCAAGKLTGQYEYLSDYAYD